METSRTMQTAEHIMQRNVFVFYPDTLVLDALDCLLQKGFSGAPVVDGDKVVGLFSERDALTAIAAAHYEGESPGTVGQHMRRDFTMIAPTTDLYKLASSFRDYPIRRLPVVDGDGRLCGIISRGDVLKALRSLYQHREKSCYQKLQEHMALRHGTEF
jgi:CBS domain-containing protein